MRDPSETFRSGPRSIQSKLESWRVFNRVPFQNAISNIRCRGELALGGCGQRLLDHRAGSVRKASAEKGGVPNDANNVAAMHARRALIHSHAWLYHFAISHQDGKTQHEI